ncbi:MAG: tetratricopeptide repeat protein [Verrucomicrobiales bacterium]|nr:tetratricopeptide repeat protein [Verrucomicrobiales bacterium]
MSRPRLIALLLALTTLLVYLPVGTHRFVNYDDDDYITNNPIVKQGLTFAGIKWAFVTGHASNWHPLTWLSHMTDCWLFGLNAGAHHYVNALFHAANAALLFVLLLRLTSLRGDASARQADLMWPCAFIAALFAWHPLHVESVAWVAERKDVLSTFFAMLTLLSYTKYAKENCRRSFWFALIFFALGLMSKPMLVTLPFVMLLLDYWPLKRVEGSTDSKLHPSSFILLTLEKWPFFLLTAASCVVTFLAQHHGEAVVSLKNVSLAYRLENLPVAYAVYLQKIFWPADLAIIYPLPGKISALAVAVAVAVLVMISAGVWLARKHGSYLIAGWLWFLGMLVPVIGLVQVGGAALADRYTYFSATGIFLAAAFGCRALASRLQLPKIILPAAAAVVLAACLAVTEHQLRYWQDGETLFRHAIAVTKNNDVALVDLGVALDAQGRFEEALVYYHEADRLAPGRFQIHNNLGNILDHLGRTEEALAEYREAVRLKPGMAFLHNGTGQMLAKLNRFDEAAGEFAEAMRLDPSYASPHLELGKMLLKQGRNAGAVDQFSAALRLEPDNFQFLAYIAHVLAAIDDSEVRNGKTALVLAAKANALTGGAQPLVLDALAMACAETGDFPNAQEVAKGAVRLATQVKLKDLPMIQQRLELYQKNQPWRESFRATNAPAKN